MTTTNIEPPLEETLRTLPQTSPDNAPTTAAAAAAFCHLPLVDLGRGETEEMARAAAEWGFFQVVNHGISKELLEKLMSVEKELFHQPFEEKSKHIGYRWGNPRAKTSKQLLWSEAFHISIADVSKMNESNKILRRTIQEYAKEVDELLQSIAECLAKAIGMDSSFFKRNFPPDSSYLRLNRYPTFPFPARKDVYGLVPHTDSSILTLVYQDQVGGLQLLKDGRWLCVKPTSNALIINIGDLFQAMSNDVYKSVRHRVVAQGFERYSAAYFYCPTVDAIMQSFRQPAVYKPFTFRQYAQQVEEDLKNTGEKVGISRFLHSKLQDPV